MACRKSRQTRQEKISQEVRFKEKSGTKISGKEESCQEKHFSVTQRRQHRRSSPQRFSLPGKDELTAYLASAPAGTRLREIARAFDIPPQGRAALRKHLAELSIDTEQADNPATLLCEVSAIDDEGIAWALPVPSSDAEPLPLRAHLHSVPLLSGSALLAGLLPSRTKPT